MRRWRPAQKGKAMNSGEAVLQIRHEGHLAYLAFNRPAKRNAVNDASIEALRRFFGAIPAGIKAVVLSGNGGHFSAGLDLSEQVQRAPQEVMRHSRNWHAVMDLIQFSGIPVIAAMSGAVMGGGLEIAAACHVRVAEDGTLFRMPEGQRGIFVGGGATVRLAAIIGADRLTEMMLTGRTVPAEDGYRWGLAHYLVPAGEALARATELALQIAQNSGTVNYLIIQSIARIANMSAQEGLYAESLAAALSQTGPDAEEGLKAFLEKRKPRFA
jgi:enoyl-CoA hydratase/carnithine racemase